VTQEEEKIQLAIKSEELPTQTVSFLSREQLLAAHPEKQQQMLETYLLKCLANSLQLPISQLNSQQSLATWLDSLMALILRSRIETDLQVRVPMEKFFGESTIAHLAAQLLNQLTLVNLITTEPINAGEIHEEREKLSL
jgi:acyl carrier protein